MDSGVSRSIEVTMSMIQESLSANPQVWQNCSFSYFIFGEQTGRRLDLEKRVTLLEEENVQLKACLLKMQCNEYYYSYCVIQTWQS